jgi:hypothetical protein
VSTLLVHEFLRRRVRARAALEGVTMRAWIVAALWAAVRAPQRRQGK